MHAPEGVLSWKAGCACSSLLSISRGVFGGEVGIGTDCLWGAMYHSLEVGIRERCRGILRCAPGSLDSRDGTGSDPCWCESVLHSSSIRRNY